MESVCGRGAREEAFVEYGGRGCARPLVTELRPSWRAATSAAALAAAPRRRRSSAATRAAHALGGAQWGEVRVLHGLGGRKALLVVVAQQLIEQVHCLG